MKYRENTYFLIFLSVSVIAVITVFVVLITAVREQASQTPINLSPVLAWNHEEVLTITSSTITQVVSGCSVEKKTFIVRGDSLKDVIESGTEITAVFGWYDCHDIARGDIVIYKFAGNKDAPIIKIVKGIPGDTLHVESVTRGEQIVINGKPLKNSKGEVYILDSRAGRLLSLYENDYKNEIPEGTYLILGNISTGSLDSSRFGLVSASDFLGKVILE